MKMAHFIRKINQCDKLNHCRIIRQSDWRSFRKIEQNPRERLTFISKKIVSLSFYPSRNLLSLFNYFDIVIIITLKDANKIVLIKI